MFLDPFLRYLDTHRPRRPVKRSRQRTTRAAVAGSSLFLESLEPRALPGFAAPQAFDAGNYPASVAVGDFNGRGLGAARRGSEGRPTARLCRTAHVLGTAQVSGRSGPQHQTNLRSWHPPAPGLRAEAGCRNHAHADDFRKESSIMWLLSTMWLLSRSQDPRPGSARVRRQQPFRRRCLPTSPGISGTISITRKE